MVEAIGGEETIAVAKASVPDLILMDIDMPRGDGVHATRMIRAQSTPLASVPILAFTPLRLDDVEILEIGMDGRVPKPCTPQILTDAAAQWRPDGMMGGAQQLTAVFGAPKIGPLIAKFRAQLLQGVADLDKGDVTAAHCIGGIAGTLGFAAVSASWIKVSEGDVPGRYQARRDARLAISQIDRNAASESSADS